MAYDAVKQDKIGLYPNRLLLSDRAIHDWYRFVLSFPPHLVRKYLDEFDLTDTQVVLDPFSGTGTVGVECKKYGLPSVGVEANPAVYFASRVKLDWSPHPDDLIQHANRIADAARDSLAAYGIEDDACEAGDTVCSLDLLETLSADQHGLLLSGSISPLPLHKVLVLKECLNRQRVDELYDHELLALIKTAVQPASNLHFGPEVGVSAAKFDAKVVASWLANVHNMAADLRDVQDPACWATVHRADSRQLSRLLEPSSIDAVITSPPYPNEKDYTRATRLELVLLGYVNSRKDLQSLKRTLLRSNTRNVYRGDDDDRWVATHEEVQRFANAIEARRIQLGKTSGFERLYARVTRLYFGGIAKHLADLRVVLRPGAKLAYVVGDQASFLQVMIRTGQMLQEIAQSLGYEHVRTDLFRTRLATATRQQLREEVIVLRWPGH